MIFNFDFLDKINFKYFNKNIFLFNFIIASNLLLRLNNIKKINDLRFIYILLGLELWSGNKVFIKKINFFYKFKIITLEIFFKTTIKNFINWFYFWKFFLYPTYRTLTIDTHYFMFFYKFYCILFLNNLNKLQTKFKYLTNKNFNVYFSIFFKALNIINNNIYILFLINIVKFYNLYDNYLIWSIYL